MILSRTGVDGGRAIDGGENLSKPSRGLNALSQRIVNQLKSCQVGFRGVAKVWCGLPGWFYWRGLSAPCDVTTQFFFFKHLLFLDRERVSVLHCVRVEVSGWGHACTWGSAFNTANALTQPSGCTKTPSQTLLGRACFKPSAASGTVSERIKRDFLKFFFFFCNVHTSNYYYFSFRRSLDTTLTWDGRAPRVQDGGEGVS